MSFTEITALGYVEAESYLILLICRFLEIFDSMDPNAYNHIWKMIKNNLIGSRKKEIKVSFYLNKIPHV
jgi:hypothetical protein